MQYKIVATLGPSSDTESTWSAMLSAGATAFRLNTSHLSVSQLQAWLDRLGPFLAAIESQPPLVLDLQGSKWRLGHFPAFDLVPGQKVELVQAAATDRLNILPVPHSDFFRAAAVSGREIVLNDAKIRLMIEAVTSGRITAGVTKGGSIASRKGITYAASDYRQEALTPQDQAILSQTHQLKFVRYALSYVKDAAEMAGYRAYFGASAYLIAKLERRPAVDQTLPISQTADELWLCRGDLGAELGIKEMAETVSQFSDGVGSAPVPVLLAGQVLEHMTEHPTPTRSEVCYLYDTLVKGYQGLVLSDETAVGRYPVESCRTAALFQTGVEPG